MTDLAQRTKEHAQRLVVRSAADARQANTLLHDIHAEVKARKAAYADEKAPHLRECQRIDAARRAELDIYEYALGAIKKAIAKWTAQLDTAHASHLRAAAAAHMRGDHNLAAAHTTQANILAADGQPLDGTSVRWRWVGTATQPDAVPRAYCEPSQDKINAVAKSTASDAVPPNIPGVTWERIPVVTPRKQRKKTDEEH